MHIYYCSKLGVTKMIKFILKIIIIFILTENVANIYFNIAMSQDIYQNHIVWSICGSPSIYLETNKYWETYQKTRDKCVLDVRKKDSPNMSELKKLCLDYKNLRIFSSNLNFHESDLCEFASKN